MGLADLCSNPSLVKWPNYVETRENVAGNVEIPSHLSGPAFRTNVAAVGVVGVDRGLAKREWRCLGLRCNSAHCENNELNNA